MVSWPRRGGARGASSLTPLALPSGAVQVLSAAGFRPRPGRAAVVSVQAARFQQAHDPCDTRFRAASAVRELGPASKLLLPEAVRQAREALRGRTTDVCVLDSQTRRQGETLSSRRRRRAQHREHNTVLSLIALPQTQSTRAAIDGGDGLSNSTTNRTRRHVVLLDAAK